MGLNTHCSVLVSNSLVYFPKNMTYLQWFLWMVALEAVPFSVDFGGHTFFLHSRGAAGRKEHRNSSQSR